MKGPPKHAKQADEGEFSLPETAKLQALDELATKKLAEIVRRSSAGEKEWQGYDAAEVEAARRLLDSKNNSQVR